MDIKLVLTWRVTAEGYTKLFWINLFYLDFLKHLKKGFASDHDLFIYFIFILIKTCIIYFYVIRMYII